MDPQFNENGVSEVPSGVYGLAVRGARLVATGIDGVVTVFDLSQSDLGKGKQFVHPQPVFAMAVSRKGDRLAVADQKGGLSVYDLDSLTLRRAELHPPRASSVSRSLTGPLTTSETEKLANVGLAISGDDSVLAVTSHDHSVRFLTFDDLAPLGSAVHAAAPRAVLFDADGKRAFTLSDDGSIQVVRPYARPELLRLAGVDGFAVGTRGEFAVWPSPRAAHAGYADPKAPDPQTPIFALDMNAADLPAAIGKVAPQPGEGLVVQGVAALRSVTSTRVHVVPLNGQTLDCSVLQHSNETDRVEIVLKLMAGPSPGFVATVARPQQASGTVLSLWSLGSCSATARWDSLVPGAVAPGAVATVPSQSSVAIRAPPGADQQIIAFGDKVAGIDVSSGGDVAIARFEGSPSISVCARNGAPGRASDGQARPREFACERIDPRLPDEAAAPRIDAVHLSASGRYAVVQASYSLRYLDRDSHWSVRRASPDQLRTLDQPFAFDADETLLAVPSGETGVRVLETAHGKVVAEIPTPSRVTQIQFFLGRSGQELIATLDGGVLRVWNWRPSHVLQGICERWNPDLAIEAAADIPPPRSRSELCSETDRARLNGSATAVRVDHDASPIHRGSPTSDLAGESVGPVRAVHATTNSN